MQQGAADQKQPLRWAVYGPIDQDDVNHERQIEPGRYHRTEPKKLRASADALEQNVPSRVATSGRQDKKQGKE